MLSIFLLIPLSLMLFVVAIWVVRYAVMSRSEERRVGKEGRSRWSPYHSKIKRDAHVREL